jgi:hypothetical protein
MLKTFICTVEVWAGRKVIKETVQADNPDKAKMRARDAVQKKTKAPYDVIKVVRVEIAK